MPAIFCFVGLSMIVYLISLCKTEVNNIEKALKCKLKYEKYSQFVYGAYVYSNIYCAEKYEISLYYADVTECFDRDILKIMAARYPKPLISAVYTVRANRVFAYVDSLGDDRSLLQSLISAIQSDALLRGYGADEIYLTVSGGKSAITLL